MSHNIPVNTNIYDELDPLPLTMLNGEPAQFGQHRKPVTLVVNVASKCGFTTQYEQLEELQKRYGPGGTHPLAGNFTVLGCPSNQFLQEMGSEESIAQLCSATYGVTFPMTSKLRLNGKNADPLFATLTHTPDAEGHTGKVKWNFEKFLILPTGELRRYSSATSPDDPAIVAAIEDALNEASSARA